MSYNNIVKGDGGSIISLNYPYNPRNYFKIDIPLVDITSKLERCILGANEQNKILL